MSGQDISRRQALALLGAGGDRAVGRGISAGAGRGGLLSRCADAEGGGHGGRSAPVGHRLPLIPRVVNLTGADQSPAITAAGCAS